MRHLLTVLERQLRRLPALPAGRDYERAGAAITLSARPGVGVYLRALNRALEELADARDGVPATVAGVNEQTWGVWREARRWRTEWIAGGPTFVFARVDIADVAQTMHRLDVDEPNRLAHN